VRNRLNKIQNGGEKKRTSEGGEEERAAPVTGGLGVLVRRSFPMNLNKNGMEKVEIREGS